MFPPLRTFVARGGITWTRLAQLRDVDLSMVTATARREISAAELVRAAIGGDEEAFATIVEQHRVSMTRVAYLVCGSADLAEEAVQAAWPIVWRRLSTVRDPDRIGAWLASVAVNEARQLVRRRLRRSVVEISVASRDTDVASDPSANVADIDLARALSKLSPEDRSLLALRYVAGVDSFELGRSLGMSASGTRRRLARLLARLRTELGDA